MRRRLTVLGGAVGLIAVAAPMVRAATPNVDAGGWTARPATYGVFVQKNLPITMSDGAVLDAEIHYPADPSDTTKPAAGRFPALLVQTPNNKAQQNPPEDNHVERGYVDVIVDVRGTGSSEGAFEGSYTAASQRDSVELIRWIVGQGWSNGNVGTHGESYFGINQLLAAAQASQDPVASKALKAIFPVVPEGDLYRTNFPGGYLTSLSGFALLYASDGLQPPGYTTTDPLRALRSLGGKVGGTELQAANLAGLAAGDGRTYDGPAYASSSPLAYIEKGWIKTPTFLAGGWYDALSQADVPKMFHALQAQGVPVKMVMGPWYHTTAGTGLPQDGLATLQELQLRWFDRWLSGARDRGLKSFGPVVYHRLGESHFHTASTWPVPGVRYRHAYLDGASTPGTSGALSATAPTATGGAGDVLPWQPVSGVCTRSTYVGTFGLAPTTPCETNDAANDATGLTYDLPVKEALDLTGPMSAHLFVSTSREDAFVTLHLSDVDPATGASNEITGGWDSLVFRALDDAHSTKVGSDYVIPYHPYTQASEASANIQPGQIYDWWIELRPSAVRIPAGHTLRFSIQTSDAVRFLPTLNRASQTVGSTLTVYHDAAHPSMIVLPVGG
jgi:putative CocE/NonD family hydrolase